MDTVSVSHEMSRFSGVFAPLLSELSSSDDIGWWLLDSGAAVTVVVETVCFTIRCDYGW